MISNLRNILNDLRNGDIHRKRPKYRGRDPTNTRIIDDVAGIDSGYDESSEPNFEQGFISLENSDARRAVR